ADVAYPVLGASVGAAVHVDAQLLDRLSPEAALQLGQEFFHLPFGLGHRVVAELVVGAGDRSPVDLLLVRIEPDTGQACRDLVSPVFGHPGDNDVLRTSETGLAFDLAQ